MIRDDLSRGYHPACCGIIEVVDRNRFRSVANWLNLSTPLGLAVARIGRAEVRSTDRHTYLCTGYRLRLPAAGAFTLGSVIVTYHDRTWLDARPRLVAHEERHSWQYVACLGLPFLPLYVVAMGWSMLRTGDRAAANVFERMAGLEDGGYKVPGSPMNRRKPSSPVT